MRGMCVWLREISPGEREMATSGGEREERQAWTHDIMHRDFTSFSESFDDVMHYR